MANEIIVKGANENNLKHIDVKIPRDKMVVLTGLSGFHLRFPSTRRPPARIPAPQWER